MKVWVALGALTLAGCSEVPIGPSVAAAPGPGKSTAQFQADNGDCLQAASGDATPGSQGVSNIALQHRYDKTFAQCMTAKGNRIAAAPAYPGPTITFGAEPHPFYPAPQPYYYMGGPKDYPFPS